MYVGEGGMGNEITYYEVQILGNTTMEFVIHETAAFVRSIIMTCII